MIWIIGGTSETRELLRRLKRDDYIVTVATYAGLEFLRGYSAVEARMDMDDMVKFIDKNDIDTVVDMSHPFAYEVSRNAREASAQKEIRYIRHARESAEKSFGNTFKSIEELKLYLSKISGTVFFTTGTKNIPDFESVRGENRFVYRVLPTTFSIEECNKSSVRLGDIVAALGPYSRAFNEAIFRNYRADFVVMKDSGDRGGTAEKIEACRALGIEPLILGRSEAEGEMNTISEILEMID